MIGRVILGIGLGKFTELIKLYVIMLYNYSNVRNK